MIEIIDLTYFRHNRNTPANGFKSYYFKYYELTLVLNGKLTYLLNNKKVSVNAGECVFINPNSLRGRIEGKQNDDYVSFNFLCDQKLNYPLIISNFVDSNIRVLLKLCDNFFQINKLENKIVVESFLKTILILLDKHLNQEKEDDIVDKIKTFLTNNFDKKLTLENISQTVFLSPNYCDSVFKQKTNYSIIDFFIREKIDYAKMLILNDSMSLTEISNSIGYDDVNYFSRLFKSKTGLSPSQFKKQNFIKKS